jgi:hypothetical protein
MEEWEYNNCWNNTWPPLPDLVVWDKWEEWIVPGESYIVHYEIRNMGPANASAGHNTSLYIDGVPLETQEVPVLLESWDLSLDSYVGQFNTTVNVTGSSDDILVCTDEDDEVLEEAEGNNCYLNTWTAPTPTPGPGRPRGGGGGGGGGGIPGLLVDVVDRTKSCSIDSDGIVGEDFEVTSRDECVTLHLSEGTEALDAEGNRLRYIEVTPVEPPPDPPEGYYLLAAFDFEPDGATFSQMMEATLCFDPDEIPEWMRAENIVIGVLDEETGEWSFISGTVDTENNTITFDIDHFTVFGVLAAPAVPTATPAPTKTPKPTVTPTPTSGGGLSTGALIGIIVAVVLLLGIGVGLWIMKQRMISFSDLWDSIKEKLRLER